MRAGKLRDRGEIQTNTPTRDEIGGLVNNWTTFARPWCGVVSDASNERDTADRTQGQTTHQVRIRYLAGVIPRMRLVIGERTFEITGVRDPDNRRRELILNCKEEV